MKHIKSIFPLLSVLLLCCIACHVSAQVAIGGNTAYDIDYLTPKEYEIGGIEFENAEHFDHRMILMVAGLQVGDRISVPGDKISTAIDNLWKQGMFEDIKITITRIQGKMVFLKIILQERPKLSKFAIRGVSGDDAKKLRADINVTAGDILHQHHSQLLFRKRLHQRRGCHIPDPRHLGRRQSRDCDLRRETRQTCQDRLPHL